MNLIQKNHIRFLVYLVIVLLSHSNLLFPTYSENPDSNYIYPFLHELSSPLEYIRKLASFETYDFQPIRDLSLWVDVWFFQKLGFVISIFFNCILWASCCFLISLIMERDLKLLTPLTTLLLVGSYSVYPIFLQTVNWGIARKHLLAFFFTLLAIRALFQWLRTRTGEAKILIFYTLSILSLPISMGFPVWVAGYLFLTDKERFSEAKKLIFTLSVVMLLIVMINWAYYKTSYTFLEVYSRKMTGFDPFSMALFLGQVFWQILFPYKLSLYYSYRDGALVGFVILSAILLFFLWKKRQNTFLWCWLLFAAVHVGILVTTPAVYFDTYALTPSLAILMIIASLFSRGIEKYRFFLIPLMTFWFSFTLSQNWIWGDPEEFFSRSYKNEESCSTAIALGFARYGKLKKLPNDLFDYIQTNGCFLKEENESPAISMRKIVFESTMIFIEDEIDIDYREKRLMELGERHFFPLTIYAALLSQLDRKEDLERVMKYLNQRFAGSKTKVARDRIFTPNVPAYCEEKKLEECQKFVLDWLSKEENKF